MLKTMKLACLNNIRFQTLSEERPQLFKTDQNEAERAMCFREQIENIGRTFDPTIAVLKIDCLT